MGYRNTHLITALETLKRTGASADDIEKAVQAVEASQEECAHPMPSRHTRRVSQPSRSQRIQVEVVLSYCRACAKVISVSRPLYVEVP